MGDMKAMSLDYMRPASITGYGASLAMGLGIPIPILNEEIMRYCSVSDQDITYPIVDYAEDYPLGRASKLGRVNMAQLLSGHIEVEGKTGPHRLHGQPV